MDRFEARMDQLETRLERIETEVRALRRDLPQLIAETMREVLRERDR